MASTHLTGQEVVERGERLYRERIRAKVEPQDQGKFIVINVDTGEYDRF